MTSKVLVAGKHALTVRVDPELYERLKLEAARENLSVQELIVVWVKRVLDGNG